MAAELIGEKVGAVHPVIPMISRACRALAVSIQFADTVDEALALHSQIAGIVERLNTLSTLALGRADQLCGPK